MSTETKKAGKAIIKDLLDKDNVASADVDSVPKGVGSQMAKKEDSPLYKGRQPMIEYTNKRALSKARFEDNMSIRDKIKVRSERPLGHHNPRMVEESGSLKGVHPSNPDKEGDFGEVREDFDSSKNPSRFNRPHPDLRDDLHRDFNVGEDGPSDDYPYSLPDSKSSGKQYPGKFRGYKSPDHVNYSEGVATERHDYNKKRNPDYYQDDKADSMMRYKDESRENARFNRAKKSFLPKTAQDRLSMMKARIDEGKSPEEKAKARGERNSREFLGDKHTGDAVGPRGGKIPLGENKRYLDRAKEVERGESPGRKGERVASSSPSRSKDAEYGDWQRHSAKNQTGVHPAHKHWRPSANKETIKERSRGHIKELKAINEKRRGSLPKSESMNKAEDYSTYSDISSRMQNTSNKINDAADKGEFHEEHPHYQEAISLLKEAQKHKTGQYASGVTESAKKLLNTKLKALETSKKKKNN